MLAQQKKQYVATDLLRIASMYNNILYPKHYYRLGQYKENDIKMSFGSFNSACRSLQIINPYDPYDLSAVLKDILIVEKEQGKIDKETYADYGIYDIKVLSRTYGNFDELIKKAKGKSTRQNIYPIYPIKHCGRHRQLVWCHYE